MKFAYAYPPYLGLGGYYSHPDSKRWNDIESHRDLIDELSEDYPDGWAMSLHSPSLKHLLPLCPKDVRVMAWVKPFASFKPGVGLAYTWEPVIIRGGRKRTRQQRTCRDHLSENITLKKGLTGAKPLKFCLWILEALNYQDGDSLEDLFPGTGIMGVALKNFLEMPLIAAQHLNGGENEK